MTIDTWIALGTLALSAIGGLMALLVYFRGEIDAVRNEVAQERQWREEADDKIEGDIKRVAADDTNRNSMVVREIADLRLNISQNYVSVDNMQKTEDRLAAAMEKIAARLETIVSRLERLTLDVAAGNVGRARRGGVMNAD